VSSSFSLSLLYVVSSRLNAAFVPVTLVCTVAPCLLAPLLSCSLSASFTSVSGVCVFSSASHLVDELSYRTETHTVPEGGTGSIVG